MFLYKKKGAIKAIIWIPKANIKCAMNKVDWMLNTIDVRNLTELSNTIYTAAACFSELVRAHKFPKTNKELWWKRRLEGQLKELIRDLDFVQILLEKRSIKKKHKDRLDRKHNIRKKKLKKGRKEATN